MRGFPGRSTPEERQRLLKLGKAIGRAIEELITIVTPSTFYRWCRDEKKPDKPKKPKGGRRKPEEVRALVVQIAKTTGFGYTRILGELRKLGIKKISRRTVANILKEEGIQPVPDRTSDRWQKFLTRHAETLWAVDFFSVRTVTTRGLRRMYVMVWLCYGTREAIVSEATEHPKAAWVERQTDAFLDQTANRHMRPTAVLHDRDKKFARPFAEKLKTQQVQAKPLPAWSPNLNGRCERFIQTIKLECLSKFIIFGKRHLEYLLAEFTHYYNTVRSHGPRDHLPPVREEPEEVETLSLADVEVQSHLGGLVRAFVRKAA